MPLNTLKPSGMHVTGVIRIATERDGDSLVMQDHFDVLGRSYEQGACEGEVPSLKRHPIEKSLLGDATKKLHQIPVKVLFNKIENSLSARFEAFDNDRNRLVCTGDGAQCSRLAHDQGTVVRESCAGPEACAFANAGAVTCQLRVRLAVQIEGQDDPLSVFELQSSGIHTYRNLLSKMTAIRALYGRLRGIPLAIRSYEHGSPAHGFLPFRVVDLILRPGVDEAALAQQESVSSTGPAYHALEAAIEGMKAESPFALDDDADEGVVFFRPIPDRQRRAGASAPGPASIADLVSAAREASRTDPAPGTQQPGEPTAAPPSLAPRVQGIVLEATPMSAAGRGEGGTIAPIRQVRERHAAKPDRVEKPPTPL